MFQRRTPKSIFLKIKNLFWPCMGWVRLVSYYKHKIGRMRGSPDTIAAGFASGVAVSFTPLMGVHILLGLLLSSVVRGSLIASIFGTFVGNPWTFPIIWTAIYKTGIIITGGSFTEDSIIHFFSLKELWYNFETVFLTMLIGSIPFAIISWFISYYIIKNLVAKYKKRRMKKLQKKIEKDFKESSK